MIDEELKIFIQDKLFPNVDWQDKEQVVDIIKKLFYKIRKKFLLPIRGLYKVKVYPHKAGINIVAIQLEEETYTNADIDLKIIILFNKSFYLKVADYSFIENLTPIYFYNNYYYIDINNIEDITKYIEYGTIISDDELEMDKI